VGVVSEMRHTRRQKWKTWRTSYS